MDVEKLTKLKELLDSGVITQEEFELQKQQILGDKSLVQKKKVNVGLIAGVAAVVIICFAIIGSSGGGSSENGGQTEPVSVSATATEVPKIPVEFQGECPVTVSASLYDNIINMPELSCTIQNKTDKEIAAVQLYFSPKNVYGEAIESIFTTNKLYTDKVIGAGESMSNAWQMLDQEVKSGDLYIYSVYFSDGSEWGDKDAATSDIKKYAQKMSVKY